MPPEGTLLYAGTPAAQEVPAVPPQVASEIKQHVLASATAEGATLMHMMRDDVTAGDFQRALSVFAAAVLAQPSPSMDQAKRLVGGEVADSERLDLLDDWILENKRRGWVEFHFVFNVESSAREQIDAEFSDRATTGSATSTADGEGAA